MKNQLSDKMMERLTKLAAKKCSSDKEDFNAYEYSGGNFDDAWSNGRDEGEVWLAQEILADLKGESNNV